MNGLCMNGFEIRVQGRRSGKTTALVELITKALIEGGAEVVVVAPDYVMLQNLTRLICSKVSKEMPYKSYSAKSLSIYRLEELYKGDCVKIFIDEINYIDVNVINRLRSLVELMPNVSLISYKS